jgi:soluble lytic murein transglycosylase-like protein
MARMKELATALMLEDQSDYEALLLDDEPESLYETARLAAEIAANYNMAAAGRTSWNAEDYIECINTFHQVYGLPEDLAAFYCPRSELILFAEND